MILKKLKKSKKSNDLNVQRVGHSNQLIKFQLKRNKKPRSKARGGGD